MMTSRKQMAIPLVALALAGLISLWQSRRTATASPPDRAAAGGTIYDYLRALEGQNPRWLANLVPTTQEGVEAIDDRLRRFGGASVSRAEVEIAPEASPEALAVTIRTVGVDAQELAWTENLIWRMGSWKLELGNARQRPGGVSPASVPESPPPKQGRR